MPVFHHRVALHVPSEVDLGLAHRLVMTGRAAELLAARLECLFAHLVVPLRALTALRTLM